MTPSQAAKEIGCSPQYVRDLIRAGTIKAKKVFIVQFINRETHIPGFYYEISDKEVEKAKKLPSRSTRGKGRAS